MRLPVIRAAVAVVVELASPAATAARAHETFLMAGRPAPVGLARLQLVKLEVSVGKAPVMPAAAAAVVAHTVL